MSLIEMAECDVAVDDPLVDVVAALRALPVDGLPADALRAAVVELGRVRSWVEALTARLLVALAAVGGASAVGEATRSAGVSGRESCRLSDVAQRVERAPVFGLALEAGDLTADHVVALAKVRNKGAVSDAQHGLLAQAVAVSVPEFVRRLAAWDDGLDAAAGVSPDAVRWSKRKLSFGVAEGGLGSTHMVLAPVEHAMVRDAVMNVADELWRNSGDRESSPVQRYADAMVEIVARSLDKSRRVVSTQDPIVRSAPASTSCPEVEVTGPP